MGALLGTLLIMKKHLGPFIKTRYSRIPRNSSIELENRFNFVKIIYKENSNFDLALRKRLFCAAKPTLLPCKRAAFGLQNNKFCNVLTMRLLGDRCCCEKYLHFYNLFLGYMMKNIGETE